MSQNSRFLVVSEPPFNKFIHFNFYFPMLLESKRAKDRARLNTYSDISSHLQEHNFNNCATKKYDLSED